jgi:hypothetical protein
MKQKITLSKLKAGEPRKDRVKKQLGPQQKWINCTCLTAQHSLRMMYFPQEPHMSLDICLEKVSFWRRIWIGIKYIFGLGAFDGGFSEVVIDREKAHDMKEFVLDFLESEQQYRESLKSNKKNNQ